MLAGGHVSRGAGWGKWNHAGPIEIYMEAWFPYVCYNDQITVLIALILDL